MKCDEGSAISADSSGRGRRKPLGMTRRYLITSPARATTPALMSSWMGVGPT